jgi:hypothetical protein
MGLQWYANMTTGMGGVLNGMTDLAVLKRSARITHPKKRILDSVLGWLVGGLTALNTIVSTVPEKKTAQTRVIT